MTEPVSPITRFAPSPTGRLHIGNIRTALYNWIYARNGGGQFILRLDDTDQERSTEEFAQGIVEDLNWLGLVPDAMVRQSDRFAQYDAAAEKLRALGLIYPCYETPEEIDRRRKRLMARGLPPVYDRAALKLDSKERDSLEQQGRKPHWRFLLPNFTDDPFDTRRTEIRFTDMMREEQIVDLASLSDPVLIRGDGSYLYTLPSVVDDAELGVTHVIRGGDHISNTGVQIAIFRAFGFTEPQFGHHNLLQDAGGEGLSKRTGALSISGLRDQGFEPMTIASLAALIGTSHNVNLCPDLTDLADQFDPSAVSRSDAKFDAGDLVTLNEKLLHAMPYEEARPRLERLKSDLGEGFWNAVRANLTKFDDVVEWRGVIEGEFQPVEQSKSDAGYVAQAAELLPDAPWSENVWKEWTGTVREQTGRKGKQLFMPLRIALTGRDYGPDLGLLLPVIGRERTVHRLS